MGTVNLYRITTTYADPYFNDFWSLSPASRDDLEDGGPVEFALPEGIEVGICDASGLPELYDEKMGHIVIQDAYNGEPLIVAPFKVKGKTLVGNEIETVTYESVVLRRV